MKMNEPLVAELDHEIQGTRKMLEWVPRISSISSHTRSPEA